MSGKKVTIINYGSSNLKSVQRAFEACGAETLITHDANDLINADRLVFPGVGSFQSCMDMLRTLSLIEPLREYYQMERPFLGICLGLQVFLENSEEFGSCVGLGFVKGSVKPIPFIDDKTVRKIPHVGWEKLHFPNSKAGYSRGILNDIDKPIVYFDHSFHANVESESDVLAYSRHKGFKITAAINRNNLYACQFHPEKSGETGLKILQNFMKL